MMITKLIDSPCQDSIENLVTQDSATPPPEVDYITDDQGNRLTDDQGNLLILV